MRVGFFWTLACLAVTLALPPQTAQATPGDAPPACNSGEEARLQITVRGVRSAKGAITIMLYDDRDDVFLKKAGRIARIRVPAQKGMVSACLPVPCPGSYAVSLYHDEDDNRKLTKNWVGMPTEGYGFSRDAPVNYRLPELDEAVFTALPGDNRLDIQIRY